MEQTLIQKYYTTLVDGFIEKSNSLRKINHRLLKGELRELFVRDNDSVTQRVFRSLKNWTTYLSGSETVESKDATLAFIRETVNEAITLISVYSRDKEEFKRSIADIIVQNLESSKVGIRNMIATYQNDRKFISNAEANIQTLEVKINSLRKKGLMSGMSDDSFMPLKGDAESSGSDEIVPKRSLPPQRETSESGSTEVLFKPQKDCSDSSEK